MIHPIRTVLVMLIVAVIPVSAAEDVKAPGWDAIDAKLKACYAAQEPKHVAPPPLPPASGMPLNGISVYRSKDETHWHYVTYGFSDLYEKSDPASPKSGYGFELTFRLRRQSSETEAPTWPMSLIENIAGYVGKSGNAFAPGQYMDANGPIRADAATDVTALIFELDPELGEISTPFGKLQFLQMVGVTTDEYQLAKDWNSAGVLELMSRGNSMLITSLDRPSILKDPKLKLEADKRQAADGASQSAILLETLTVSLSDGKVPSLTIQPSERVRADLARLLKTRLGKSKPLDLMSKDAMVSLVPGAKNSWEFNEGNPTIHLTPQTSLEMSASLEAVRPTYSWPGISGLVLKFQVVR